MFAPTGSSSSSTNSGGIVITDESFVDQGVQLEFIDPELGLITYKTSPSGATTFLTRFDSVALSSFHIAFLSFDTIGCEGANSARAQLPTNAAVAADISSYTSNLKLCFSPLTSTSSDNDFMDQGYLINGDDPQLLIDETFNTDAINLPTGITRNTANGDLYISSSQDGKI